jgi:isochorismate hydrolase
MLMDVKELRGRHSSIVFDPGRAALLVLDMQDYFLSPASHAYVPSSPAIIPGIQILTRAFKRMDRPVIFTRHVNAAADAGMMAAWWKDLVLPESPLSQISGDLDTTGCLVFEKHQYDAFHETGLETHLRRSGVGQIIITGVMTHLCCETTARSAFMRGFQVFFAIDGTATYNEAFHRASLLNLSHGFALPVLVAEILEGLHP